MGLIMSDVHKKSNISNYFFFLSETYTTLFDLFEVSIKDNPIGSQSAIFRLFQKYFPSSHFSVTRISFMKQVFDVKLTYIVDTINISSTVILFLFYIFFNKIHFWSLTSLDIFSVFLSENSKDIHLLG